MPVFIGNDIIECNHPIEEFFGSGNAESVTAIEEVLIERSAVVLFLCLDDSPCRNQFCVLVNEIFTDAVGCSFVPRYRVGHMRDVETFHDFGGDDFVQRLLTERIGTAFDEAPLSIDDLPSLFQITV